MERLQRLERQVRALTIAFVVVTIAFAFALSRIANPETLSVQRIQVTDAAGRILIVLGQNPMGQPVLIVHDRQGRKRFGVSLDKEGDAMVAVFDADGRVVAALGR